VRWIARGADSELRAGTPSLAGSLPAVPAAPILPVPVFAAEIDPLPTLDELLDPPAMCEAFLPGPAPEPVFRYVQSSVAAAIEFSGTVTLPAALSFLVMPHVPRIRESQAAPFAEAVMAEVVRYSRVRHMVIVGAASRRQVQLGLDLHNPSFRLVEDGLGIAGLHQRDLLSDLPLRRGDRRIHAHRGGPA